jgi:hypothetical protein
MILVGSSETVLQGQQGRPVSWLTGGRRQRGVEQPEQTMPKSNEPPKEKQHHSPKASDKEQEALNATKERQLLSQL